ncbi:MAG: T9SS type A sorting domain-containing protein [Aureispira sp.]|nr:T9SS type A sorting domain-containing protein [Aureispira sp.]
MYIFLILIIFAPLQTLVLFRILIRIYPTVVSNQLVIEHSGLDYNTGQIYTILGQPIQEIKLYSDKVSNKTTLDLSNLPSGIYFLKVGNNFSSKFIKN